MSFRKKTSLSPRRSFAVLRRRLSGILPKIWILALGGILLLLSGLLFIASISFTVQRIEVARKDFRTDGYDIRAEVEHLSGTSMLMVSEKKITTQLKKKFSEIKSIQLEKKWPDTIRILVTTYPVVFRWVCTTNIKSIDERGEIIEEAQEKIYFINTQGRISFENPEEKEAFLIYEKDPCPSKIKMRDLVFSASKIVDIFWVRKRLEEILEQKIIRIGYFRNAQEIHLYTEKETAIWVDFDSPLKKQIKKLRIAVQQYSRLRESLDHIDLRVAEKIYFSPKK